MTRKQRSAQLRRQWRRMKGHRACYCKPGPWVGSWNETWCDPWTPLMTAGPKYKVYPGWPKQGDEVTYAGGWVFGEGRDAIL